MSTVELPLVPSARSTNSSASSSRSHQHSAGSTTSEVSARSVRSQRSLYQAESEEGEEDEQSDEGEMQEEEPEEASGGLWDEVEHFLNKPSPSFSKLAVKAAKAEPQKSTLPALNRGRVSTDNQASRPSRPSRGTSTGTKTIDPKLLQEAFAYANQLQQMNFEDDDGEEQQQSWRSNKTKMLMQRAALSRANSSSSSSSSSNAFSGGSRGSRSGTVSSSSSNSDVRKKKTKPSSVYSSSVKPKAGLRKKRNICGESPSSSAGSESKAKSKGHMDPQILQSLVSNFQNGTTLDELRRELAASQQSMAVSRQVLQDAAQTFFQSQ